MISYNINTDTSDIINHANYLNIFIKKDSILKIEKKQHTFSYNIIKSWVIVKNVENDTLITKINQLINDTRIICLSHKKREFSAMKYIEKKIRKKKNYRCSYVCLIINYILKKYIKCKLIDKTILIISHISGNTSVNRIEDYGTLFTPNALYLFDHCKNCTIYGIINTDNNNKYNQTVVNKKNNNTYHLLTWNTNGNILDRTTFDIVNERLKDVVFDNVIIYNLNDALFNNIMLVYLHVITRHSDNLTQLLCNCGHTMRRLFSSICAHMYEDVFLYSTFIHYDFVMMHASNLIKNNTYYKNIDMINDILSSDKYIEIQYNIPLYMEDFNNKIYMYMYNHHKALIKIMDLYDTDIDNYNMIIKKIKKKQHAYAKKYKKIALPY